MTDLLPANSTAVERAISNAMAREDAIETPANLMWDPARIPAAYLPWLAWGASVDNWDADWSDARKRDAIAASPNWHRIKGTRKSVEIALGEMGHPDAVVIEDRDLPRLGRGWVLGRGWRLGPSDPSWADYWVQVPTPLYRADAEKMAVRLADTAPARCRLRSISAVDEGRFRIGDGLWQLGDAVTLGSTYKFGDDNG